jgi:hypothetical protein
MNKPVKLTNIQVLLLRQLWDQIEMRVWMDLWLPLGGRLWDCGRVSGWLEKDLKNE